jgi:hypothetical protein
MERVVDKYLRDEALARLPLHSYHHAYQAGKSAETALHQLVVGEACCCHFYCAWWLMIYWPNSIAVAYFYKDKQMMCVLAVGNFPNTVWGLMQWALSTVETWCDDVGLSVNPEKTGLVAFSR